METLDAMRKRFSANRYDSNRPVDTATLEKLIDAARQAPSAFNVQHARFFAVEDLEARRALRQIAYDQAKVEEAPLALVVLGDTEAYKDFHEIANSDVEAGIYSQELGDYFVNAARQAGENQTAAHDEAIRSGSFAAMNLMNAATELGLATGPMIGFDPVQLKKTFNIADRYIPVMMITVGYPAEGNWPKKTRRPVEQLLVRDGRPGNDHAFSR